MKKRFLFTFIVLLLPVSFSSCSLFPEAASIGLTTPNNISFPASVSTPTADLVGFEEDLFSLISNAKDGDTLYLGVGTYTIQVGIILQKSLTLVGMGPDVTHLVFENSTPNQDYSDMIIKMSEGSLTIKGMEISYTGENSYGVIVVLYGKLSLFDCTVNTSRVELVFENASQGSFSNCSFTPGTGKMTQGFELSGQVKLAITNCLFTAFTMNMRGNVNVEINSSRFTLVDNGLEVTEGTSLTITDSFLGGDFILNAIPIYAVNIMHWAQVSISTSTISETDHGVRVSDSANAVLLNNKFTNNGSYAIGFANQSTGSVFNNSIDIGGVSGITISDQSAPIIENNRIDGYSHDAIGIVYVDKASGIAKQNTISGNHLGISVNDEAFPTLEENWLDSNLNGIQVSGNASPVIQMNDLHGTGVSQGGIGIHFLENALGQVRRNAIEGFQTSLLLSDETAPVFENNQVTR